MIDPGRLNPVLDRLYGRARLGWNPIYSFKYRTAAPDRNHVDVVTWTPKKACGNNPTKYWGRTIGVGVWGGSVATYSLGFDQQPVELCFVGLVIDADNHGAGFNAGVSLPKRTAELLPEAYVRTSKSGRGAHVFLILDKPVVCSNKAAAQQLAKQIAVPYVRRLTVGGVVCDKVAVNQLWIWSEGGGQADVQPGRSIDCSDFDCACSVPDCKPLPPAPTPAPVVGDVAALSALGPRCRAIVDALIAARLIVAQGDVVAARALVHIKPVQDALRTLPWLAPYLTVQSAGTRLNEPNSVLSIRDGKLELFSFVTGQTVLSLPTFA